MTDDAINQMRDRAIGTLLGQGVADALGAPYEFRPAGTLNAVFPEGTTISFLDGGVFGWEAGEFTDDTQMAILLAENLLDGWDQEAMWATWRQWAISAKDVGTTTRPPLMARSFAESRDYRRPQGRGNGCVMRVAPVGVAGAVRSFGWTERIAREQAQITHLNELTVEASVILAVTIAILVSDGATLDNALRHAIEEHCEPHLRGYFTGLLFDMPAIGPNGYGDICLSQAVHAMRARATYEGAIRFAINGGDDADTVGAVTGALAGAFYGVNAIPMYLAEETYGYIDGGKWSASQFVRQGMELIGLDPYSDDLPELSIVSSLR